MKDEKPKLTPTQERMMRVLADGENHTRKELHACCGPCSPRTVGVHMVFLRRRLKEYHLDVMYRRGKYKLVRLLASPYDGLS